MKLRSLPDSSALAPGSELARRWDALVQRSPGIDDFCSSTRWAVPAHLAFAPEGRLLFGEGEHGLALLLEREHPSYRKIVHPLEPMWGFGSGIAGEGMAEAAAEAGRALCERGVVGLAFLPGLPDDEAFFRALVEALAGQAQLLPGQATGRARADLRGGREAFLSRRGAGLRRSLERARRKAEAAGVEFVGAAEGASWPEVYERIQAVEARSWKGMMRLGIGEGPMRTFYEHMGARLLPAGAFRVLFARRGEEDLAYHFGGIHAGIYRGLQHAYVEEARREGLGNLTHLEMIARVAGEGVHTYDLGQEIDYKLRWSDRSLSTRTYYLVPRR
ncbi:MAG: GNAT family N-acetyltransferase [Deltaproteobacteria bacterium]|nr:GNAT family N-acetyltransferase [Deltaproteobacteria bacterium]